MSNLIKESAIPIVTTIDDADYVRIVLSTGETRRILLSKFLAEKTPISLSIGGTLSTNSDAFKDVNGFSYKWYGSKLNITSIKAVQGTADTGSAQGTVNVKIGGTSAQSSVVSLSSSNDTYVTASLTTTPANLIIESGDTITIDIDLVAGTNADAEDLCVFIYCEATT